MIEHRIKVRLDPWDDPSFHAAFEGACDRVRGEGIELDSRAAAERTEVLLRAAGYPEASVDYESRTVDEVLLHVAHWIVRRSAPAMPGRPLRPPTRTA